MARRVRLRKVRFDAAARSALDEAHRIASERNRLAIGVHHLVAAAMVAPGQGRDTLAEQGVEAGQLLAAFDAASGESVQLSKSKPSTAVAAKVVLGRALDAARAEDAAAAGLEHLLLAGLRAGSPVVAVGLGHVGIDLARLQDGLGLASVDVSLPPGAPAVFARYSAEARQVVVIAKFVAIHVASDTIEPLHMALALAGEESRASQAMNAAGLDVRAIWGRIDPEGALPPFRFDLLPVGGPSHEISESCRRAMEAAGGPADTSGSLSVEPQHLALALLDVRAPELESLVSGSAVDEVSLRRWLLA